VATGRANRPSSCW